MSVTFWVKEDGPNDDDLNFSNSNTASLFRLIGVDSEYLDGDFQKSELPSLMQKLLFVINSNNKRSSEVEEPYSDENIFYCGRSDESIIRRAESLLNLFDKAYKENKSICFG